jgi:hypothetical protein
LAAARFAAFALAICSRKATDDLRGVRREVSSTESTVTAVDTVDALDNSRSPPEAVEALEKACETSRGERVGNADLDAAPFKEGKDGFLNRPFTDDLGFKGRAATVLDPYFDTLMSPALIGLGVRGPTDAESDALACDLPAVGGLLAGVFATPGNLLDGVPCTVGSGVLYAVVKDLKLVLCFGPEPDPGRLTGLID